MVDDGLQQLADPQPHALVLGMRQGQQVRDDALPQPALNLSGTLVCIFGRA